MGEVGFSSAWDVACERETPTSPVSPQMEKMENKWVLGDGDESEREKTLADGDREAWREWLEEPEEIDEEGREVKQMRKVHEVPSETERKKHEITHIPFRNWCQV